MTSSNHILVFPHEHDDILGAARCLSKQSKSNDALSTLLSRTSDLVKDLFAPLHGHEGYDIGVCEDIVELAERHEDRDRQNAVVEMILLTTIGLGQLVVLMQKQPGIWQSCGNATTIAAGYGVGLMVAAVAVTAQNPDDAVCLGLRAITATARMALQLDQIGKHIEDASQGDWSRTIHGRDHNDVQCQLNRVNDKLYPLQHAYVGQIFQEHIVVHGPPSTLAKLEVDAGSWTSVSKTTYRCPIFGAHLPSMHNIEAVDGPSRADAFIVQQPLYSAHTPYKPLLRSTFGELLQDMFTEISHKQVQVTELVKTVGAYLHQTGLSKVVLTTVGSTWDTSSIVEQLSSYGQEIKVVDTWLGATQKRDENTTISSGAIAVVGMSGRFPQSDNLAELWALLQSGTTTHQEIPADRFRLDDFYDVSRKKHNAVLARHGCFIKQPGDFDHRLFNISPREADQMDPVQRMLLMTTYEALEMAGYSESSDTAPPRIATYFGQTVDDWKTINMQQGIDTHFLPAVNRGFGPGRLCHYFRWAGGFYSIDTGCSSSATGICIARDALTAGTCDAAVVGGGTLLSSPEWFAGLSQGGFLSPTGACKTYSEAADGYCRGEGVAVVVLKRLEDAIRSKDNVLAVIAGASRNTNAGEGSITHPGQHAQEQLYRRVLRQAAVRPHEIDVVEMHGTGTQAGDRVETQAVHNVLVSTGRSPRTTPLTVGAVKANLGHSEAAAGVVSLIKSILMLQHDTIPPQAGQPITLNPHLSALFDAGMQLANGQSWPRQGSTPRHVFINNFDAAGGNVSLLIRDPPVVALQSTLASANVRSHHVVVISGHTDTALAANKARLREHLARHPDIDLASLAYTSTARRMHQSFREAYVVSSLADLLHQLDSPGLANSFLQPTRSVVFAFTGQGSQYVGMGGELYRTSPTFRQLLDSYQSLCDAQGLKCDILSTVNGQDEQIQEDHSAIECNMQVATVALEIALATFWQRLGVRPTTVIGHSLGEFAALCIAGVLSVSDTLLLVHRRATLITRNLQPAEATMLVVALPTSVAQSRIGKFAASDQCEICCINGSSSTVLGGPYSAIVMLESELKSEGIVTTRLAVKYAFHTRQMDPILEELETAASHIKFHSPKISVASSLLGRVVRPGEEGIFSAVYIRRHSREPVHFYDAVRACQTEGLITGQSFVLEIGPHPVCIGLIAAAVDERNLQSFASLNRKRGNWETVSQCLAAAHKAHMPVSWEAFHRDHLSDVQLIGDLPTYAFENKTFWHAYETDVARIEDNRPRSFSPASLPYTSLQKIEQLQQEDSNVHAVFTADSAEHHLGQLICGHIVDGVAICPASVFIDMAYSAAHHLDTQIRHNIRSSIDCYSLTNLKMQSPLVIRTNDDARPLILVEATLNLSNGVVAIAFKSTGGKNASPVEHGSCFISMDQSHTPENQAWSRMKTLVEARMHSLDTSLRPKAAYAYDRKLFYRCFSEIVDYASPYHAVEEASVSTDFEDASVVLQLPLTPTTGTFTCNPFAVDAMVHVPGFLLNADVHKSKEDVHIANHIGALHVFGSLSLSSPCRAYATVRERDIKAGTSLCDVYVTSPENKLLALCTDICFKKLDRAFFSILTGSVREVKSAPSTKRTQTVSRSAPSWSTTPELLATPASEVDALSEQLLNAVSIRSGISMAELQKHPDMTFADMGVDSQMSIQVLADFHKSTAVELPAAFFINFPTPSAVERELGFQPLASDPDVKRKHVIASPSLSESHEVERDHNHQVLSDDLIKLIDGTLGLDTSSLPSTTTFESMGMDSMLSIKIISTFQAETGVELPAAFFSDYPNIAALRAELDGVSPGEPQQCISTPKKTSTVPSKDSTRQQKLEDAVSRPILIQGQSRSRDAPLFLPTDGSGTVESYIHLSALPKGRRVYALESPFLQSPDFDFSVQEMTSIFLRSVRKIQARGPYLIGGWSAGSVYAYDLAQRLATEGETIQALIILDMRAPSLISSSVVRPEFLEKLGTFEGINRARNLSHDLSVQAKKHLLSTCRALSRYDAPPFPAGRGPRHSTVVWARLGLDARPDAPKAAMRRPQAEIGKPMEQISLDDYERYFNSWFYGRREDFGTNGWEDLLGDNISVHDVDGDHFSMMMPPLSAAVGKIVRDAVAAAFDGE